MATKLFRVPEDPTSPLPTPLNPDGEPFGMCMVFNNNSVIAFSDTATELVGLLIPGYMNIPAEDLTKQGTARILHNVTAQVRNQARILTEANLDLATPDELAILTGSRDTQPVITEWACPIPLILVDGFYAPYTEHPVPVARPRDNGAEARRILTGPDWSGPDVTNLIWLGFADEEDFLTGLDQIGDIQLGHHEPDTDEVEDFLNSI